MIDKDFSAYTKVSGVTYKNDANIEIQNILPLLKEGGRIYCIRDYSNKYDSNAIKVFYFSKHESIHIGYIKRELAAEIAPFLDKHSECDLDGIVEEVTGGNGNSYGCNIRLWIQNPDEPSYEEIKCFQEGLKRENNIQQTKSTNKNTPFFKSLIISFLCLVIAVSLVLIIFLIENVFRNNKISQQYSEDERLSQQYASESYKEKNPTSPIFTPTPSSNSASGKNQIQKKDEPIVKISDLRIRYTILPPNSIGTVYMEGTYTNNSKYTIKSFSLTVLLKDKNDKTYLSCYDTVLPGETSPIFDSFGPDSQSPDDVEFLECSLQVIDETGDSKFIDYDYKLKTYSIIG